MNNSLRNIIILIISATLLSLSCSQNSGDGSQKSADRSIKAEYSKAIVNVNIADLRKEPEKHAERVSQALYNEVVEIIERNENYAKIRQWDGYEGWIRAYCLDDDMNNAGTDSFMVSSYLAPAYIKPDANSDRKAMFPYGSMMYGEVEDHYLRVESSRYGIIYLELKEMTNLQSIKPDSANICVEAGKFIGAPYLWGGKSFYGIDCSGLTQMVMKRFGIDLYRDSRDQQTQGFEIERENIQAGDLLFFPHHVGLAISKDLMIHSTGRNGGVAYNSLNPESPLYSEYFDKNYQTARRIVK